VFPSRFPSHVTLKVQAEVPSLRNVRLVREIEQSFAAACDRGTFRVVQYSIQNDHVHLIVEARGRAALGRGMKSIGARLARAVNRVYARTGAVLADRYHLRMLKTPREVRNALAYVLLNGRRHAAKRRGKAVVRRMQSVRIDPASSGRWFEGWMRSDIRHASKQAIRREKKKRFEEKKAKPPAAGTLETPTRSVASPHMWLLRIGWRRHGLIDPLEIPG